MTRRSIGTTLDTKVRNWAKHRCSYCLLEQEYAGGFTLEIEHISPVQKGGTNVEANLALSCKWCNLSKGTKIDGLDPVTGNIVRLFNPRIDNWSEHFQWATDKVTLEDKTEIGRATVLALNMNRQLALKVRGNWVIAGWHPPKMQ
ncbi:HNH endonuclease [Gloeobacter violaceus]|uniref:Gll1669 protein n=1 Tax=Gloeobacter violaceus (strain ATCC 29082 / PCC 7421) TaxID=251221 RepID=Q7NK11_GLOVI|nr:HNH endonuclease signature motif containing protein [Gloeobacter violaceus]BAC89610.1 gll1669 [Gloeobacter violaceus PCC 7421]